MALISVALHIGTIFLVEYIALVSTQTKTPHILFIVVDDLGFSDLSYHGSEISTPNFDSLASTGIDLQNYYVSMMCSPTRVSIMTSRYPWRTGIGLQNAETIVQGTKAHLPYDQLILPELMKKANWNTQITGKWHLGFASKNDTPIGRGFNQFFGYYGSYQDYYSHIQNNGFDFHLNDTNYWNAKNKYSDDLYFNYLFKYLQTNYNQSVYNKQPLFMYLATQTIHAPILGESPPSNGSYINTTNIINECNQINDTCRNTYCQKLKYLDVYIGKLIEIYKQLDLWKDTFLIVSTDNGGLPSYLDNNQSGLGNDSISCGSNYPLRGGKATLFEGGVKGLGFVNGGENIFPKHLRGSIDYNLYYVTDWLPTILNLIGHKELIPNNVKLDGINILNTLFEINNSNNATKRNELILYENFDIIDDIVVNDFIAAAIIKNEWKYIYGKPLYDCYFPPPPQPKICLNDSNIKYLFNLSNDPYEQYNLIDIHPEIGEYLSDLIISDAIENGWMYNEFNIQWNASCPQYHNGSWESWLENQPQNDIPMLC